jgi:hypothetical protein
MKGICTYHSDRSSDGDSRWVAAVSASRATRTRRRSDRNQSSGGGSGAIDCGDIVVTGSRRGGL